MGLESVTTIYDLNTANPTGSDSRTQGDDHIRNLKTGITNTFLTGTDASKPAAGTLGRIYFASDVSKAYFDDGSAWIELTSQTESAAGDCRWTLRASEATGWLFLNGRTIGHAGSGADLTGTTYQNLYNVLKACDPNAGTETWGVNLVTMPDMAQRIIAGYDSGDAEYDKNGETGGAETVTLATANLPGHTHGVGTLAAASDGAHTHSHAAFTTSDAAGGGAYFAAGANQNNPGDPATSSAGAHTHTLSGSTASAGSGTAFDVRNKFIVMRMEVKY